MLTDGPVTVEVRVTVVHFVAVREMSEVRNNKFCCYFMFAPSVKFQIKGTA